MPRFDAIILGGGPSGASAGLMFARAGWRVAVIEKSEFPRRKVCGEFISATTLPLLFELGIGDEFLSRAGPEVRRVGLFESGISLTAPMPPLAGLAGSWGRALGREHLDQLLLNAAADAGANVWQPWKGTGLERSATGWSCTIARDDTTAEITAPIVIAATGSWEKGPLPQPVAAAHRDSDLLAFKAHFKDADLARDLMPLLVFPGGYGGLVNSDAGRVSLSCCIRRDTLTASRGGGRAADAVLRHIQNSCAGVRAALKGAHLDGAWLSAGPIRPGIRPRYANGIFYVGNIAGEAHPLIAEGISMAMQSSWLLCQNLLSLQADVLAGRAHEEVGRLYAANWRDAFALRIRAAAFFAHLAVRPAAATVLRPFLKQFPQMLTIGARFAGKAKALRGTTAPLGS